MKRMRKKLLVLGIAAAIPLAMMAMTHLACAGEPAASLLTQEQIADGWIMLFDGESTFGWAAKGDSKWKAADGALVCESGSGWLVSTTEFCDYSLKVRCLAGEAKGVVAYGVPKDGDPAKAEAKMDIPSKEAGQWQDLNLEVKGKRGVLAIQAAPKLQVRSVLLKPLNTKAIFNGKDLTGWKPLVGPKWPSVFTVTPEGWLNIKNGPGDIQTEEQWKDFCLQLEIISNGEHLNSGVFFRADAGQFWQGYEAQIRNQWTGDDRTKPVDFGTGAIYARQPARKVVPSDKEWFTMTVVAAGNHLSTWVNGYQVTDYTDDNPPGRPRNKQCKLDAGVISLQGHDPTTNLSFRNIRIAAYP